MGWVREHALAAAVLALTGGCYSPSPREGVACSEAGGCPSGQVCTPANICVAAQVPGGGRPDAGVEVIEADAGGPVVGGDGGMTVGCGIDFAVANIDSCPAPLPATSWDGDVTINTDAQTINGAPFGTVMVQPGNIEALVATLESLSVGAGGTVRAVGSRPLVLVVQNDATIAGRISVNGDEPGGGAGGGQSCIGSTGSDGATQIFVSLGGGAGGGGGGYGGSGGNGAAVSLSGGATTAGGAPRGSSMLRPLLGGCSGGAGGVGTQRGGGAGGVAGGGLQITAGGTLNITGVVTANGTGGIHAPQELTAVTGDEYANGGGGGGGSGGGVLLQARVVVIDGSVSANGGGGGEGSWYQDFIYNGISYYPAGSGSAGLEGAITRAAGGNIDSATELSSAPPHGGAGGAGGAGSNMPDCGQASVNGCAGTQGLSVDYGTGGGPYPDGGGGGGGAAGRIRIEGADSVTINGVVSPAPG